MSPFREIGSERLRGLLEAVVLVGSDLDLEAVLQRIAESAALLTEARYAALGVLDAERSGLADFFTVGLDSDTRHAMGALPKGIGVLGLLISDPRPLRIADIREHPSSYGFPPHHPPMASFLGVPIRVRDRVFGNLYLTEKAGGGEFTDVDEELIVTLAAAAGIAIENARLHGRVRELVLLEDRERIARDLHDTVIQRLFAVGLSLQGAGLLAADPEVVARVERAVDEIDLTMRHIRTVIYGLQASAPTRGGGLRRSILDLAVEAAGLLGFEPRVLFEGPVDAGVPPELVPELLAVLRESLSNVSRHARAANVGITVTCGNGQLVVEVEDDGEGVDLGKAAGGLGLRNLAARARRHGGGFEVGPAPAGGTVARWTVPLDEMG